MIFYFKPRTKVYKSWKQVKIGDRVLYRGVLDNPATVRNIYYDGPAVIEFDRPVPFTICTTHDCCGKVPSGNGYYVFIRSTIEKIIE